MPYDETDEDLARVWWYDGIPEGRISDDERAELMAWRDRAMEATYDN